MRAGTWLLCAALCVCAAVAAASVFRLAQDVFEIRASRDAEIRAARVAELTRVWEAKISRAWTRFSETLDAIPPEKFSEKACRNAAAQSIFGFPPAPRAEAPTPDIPRERVGGKFSAYRKDGYVFLLRDAGTRGVQSVAFSEKELFAAIGAKATETLRVSENAELRVVPAENGSGFGVVRTLPGAKLEFDLGTRERAESVAAERAAVLAGVGVLAMLAAIVALSVRVFLLSEKRYLFASSVSHELKTPLAELRVCTDSALSRGEGDDALSADLRAIKQSSRELGAIVENLLFFSRMKNGKYSFPTAEFSVSDVFSRIFERLGEHLLAANMDAVFDIAPDARERRVRTSLEILGRILFNLADNAAKYAYRADGGNVVAFRVNAVGQKLRIDVEDEGAGIPSELRRRLFKPLAGKKRRAAGTHGLGLGLFISATAAKRLDGKLSLLKSDAAGTVFRLEIPLSRDARK